MKHPALEIARVPRRPPLIDFLIVGLLALWAVLEALFLDGPGERWERVLVGLGFALPLLLRRRAPVPVMLFIAGLLLARAITADTYEEGAAPFPCLLIATFSVALHVRNTAVAVAVGCVPVAAMLATLPLDYYQNPESSAADYLILPFFVGGAWLAGRFVRRRALAVAAVEAQSGERAREAAAAERVRIARELHDVVAHSVSIVAVQAGAAQAFLERDPGKAHGHLEAVRRAAQEALTEMRRLTGVLREDEASYAPQPGLERLGELVSEARAAGIPVELVEEGERGAVAAGVDLAAYRIVQEALTNVRRHAGAVDTRVRVAYESGWIELEVANAPGATGNGAGGGHGLVGMRERARVYGGTVTSGVEPGGGFAVRARLPREAVPA